MPSDSQEPIKVQTEKPFNFTLNLENKIRIQCNELSDFFDVVKYYSNLSFEDKEFQEKYYKELSKRSNKIGFNL